MYRKIPPQTGGGAVAISPCLIAGIRMPHFRRTVAQIGGGMVAISPVISQESWTNRWGLTVPDFWTIIEAKNASFYVHLGDLVLGWEWLRKMRHS